MRLCYCGNKILALDSRTKYCSRSCSASINNMGKQRHGRPPRSCDTCGLQILGKKKYCNNKCSARAKRQERYKDIEAGTYNCKGSLQVLRHYLIEHRGYKCESCLNSAWLNQPIPLDVHHRNGNPEDHKLDNVQLLCKNCHALTPTYGAKNKGNGRSWRYKKAVVVQ
jgi:hypothetical protein